MYGKASFGLLCKKSCHLNPAHSQKSIKKKTLVTSKLYNYFSDFLIPIFFYAGSTAFQLPEEDKSKSKPVHKSIHLLPS